MITYAVAALVGCSIALATFVIAQLLPNRPAAVKQRLSELEQVSTSAFQPAQRRARQSRRDQMRAVLQQLGERAESRSPDAGALRLLLSQAGYRRPDAVILYRGIRVGVPLGLGLLGVLMAPLVGPSGLQLGIGMAAIGWILPAFYVGSRARARQKELRLALPDALDALVVCVEAGLGLNQAMVRVADEIRHISVLMSEELTLTNLEIRAGTPREDALRNLGTRTGLEDLRSLVTMLIQTDRFGTSIAQALRVQSDTLREKRRQRAEEAAAKTSIKMLFPLVFFIFPAMFIITLGPAVIQLIEGFSKRQLQ